MAYTLVRRVYLAALGKWIGQPLKHWLEEMYRRIDHIASFEDMYFWLQDLRKLSEVQRRTGTDYNVEEYWGQALEETPMSLFTSAETEVKDWRDIFLSVEKNPQAYREFWAWVSDAYEVRVWLAQVYRIFWNLIWQEHRQRLDGEYVEPDEPEPYPIPGKQTPKPPPKKEPKKPKTWEEEEALARAEKGG